MPYAGNDQISKLPITDGIEITDAEYRQALDGMMAGQAVQVADGVMSLVTPSTDRSTYWIAPAEKHQTEPGESPPAGAVLTPPPGDAHVIEGSQWVYSLEREREQMVAPAWAARAALLDSGLLDDVEALMDNPGTARRTSIEWKFKPTIRRNHPLTIAMASALGMTNTELDDLFRAAMQME